MSPPDFTKLPPDFLRILQLAKEKHRLALHQAPTAFAGQNMAKLSYEVEHDGTIALLRRGRLISQAFTPCLHERQSRLEALFSTTKNHLLKEEENRAGF